MAATTLFLSFPPEMGLMIKQASVIFFVLNKPKNTIFFAQMVQYCIFLINFTEI